MKVFKIQDCFTKFAIMVLTLFFVVSSVIAKDFEYKSYYQLQAELVVKFIKFVSWPEKDRNHRKTICLVHKSPLLTKLKILSKEHKISGVSIALKNENDYFEDCDVVLINHDYKGYLERLILKLRDKTILTIGFHRDFAKKGGIVELNYKDNRINIKINSKSLISSGLRIDQSLILASEIL